MGIYGSAIGGAIGIGASIFGGISASRAMKKIRTELQRQKQENSDWYNRRYNENATQRADAQLLLRNLDESIRRRNAQAAGRAAVMGGTEESVAAAKAANAEAMADATAQIAAAGERRKDQVESEYKQTSRELDGQLLGMEQARAQNVAQAVSGVAQAGANLAGMF